MQRRPRREPAKPVAVQPVDFVQVMVDLYNAGCNAGRVAEHLEIATATAQGWERGQEPKYNNGARLLMLRERYCRK